jgi:hypothetical protein
MYLKHIFKPVSYLPGSWYSSVGIVSDYRLDDRGSIPGSDKGLFL